MERKKRKNGRFTTNSTHTRSVNLKKVTEKRSGAGELNLLPGRRIVDIRYFFQQFANGCRNCESDLNIIDFVKERRFGLASKLYFRCRNCEAVSTIQTSKRSKEQKGSYTINIKASLGNFKYF